MKIGFYGNPNNYAFMLARAMRRLGHEVRFIVVSREMLNRPEFRYADIATPYPAWILDRAHLNRWILLLPGPARHEVLAQLNACDICFLAEEGPALAANLRVPYVALLTGSNLEIFADPEKAGSLKIQAFPRRPWLNRWCQALLPTSFLQARLTQPQRAGICGARLVTHYARGLVPNGDRLLDEMEVPDHRRIFLLMTDLNLIALSPPPANRPVRVFCVARLTWKREIDTDLVELDYKGTDVLLHGLAMLKQRSFTPLPELHLVRKGRHVNETAALASELGIDRQITWREQLSQSEVLAEYARADIVVDQLANSVIAMGGLDAMASGRPLIANARPEIFSDVDEPPPICQARTPGEVCSQLERLAHDPAERERVGLASRRYVEKHFSSDAAARQVLTRLGLSPTATP